MPRVSLRAATTAVTLLVFATSVATPLAAHTALRRSQPAADASLVVPPRFIRLWFTERVALGVTSVRLRDPAGVERSLRLSSDSSDSSTVMASIPDMLPPGGYLVIWQTVGRDGHPIRGRFRFVVLEPMDTAGPSIPSAPTPNAVVSGGAFNATLDSMMRDAAAPRTTAVSEPLEAAMEYRVARWTEFVGLLTTVGAVAFYFLIASGLARAGFDLAARDATDGVRQLGLGGAILTLASALARAHGEVRALSVADAPATWDLLWTVLGETAWGRGWWFGVAGALVTLTGLLMAKRWSLGWRVALVGGAMLVVSPAMTGHAASTARFPWIAVGLDVAHVTGAACWLGGLLAVLVGGLPAVGRRPVDERGPTATALLHRFHLVARVAVAVVLATGLVTTLIRVRTLDALTHTSYGSLLLYKVFVFFFAATIGLYNWQKVLPRIADQRGVARLRRSATVELLVAAMILALTAALVAEEPPDLQRLRVDSQIERSAP